MQKTKKYSSEMASSLCLKERKSKGSSNKNSAHNSDRVIPCKSYFFQEQK